MSRNTMLAIVALMLVALVGGVGAFWAYRKYKQKQSQEHQLEGSLGTVNEEFDPEAFRNLILADDVQDAVVEKHQLVSVWEVTDKGAAKAQLQDKFAVYVREGELKVRYQDKDKDLAESILRTILKIHRDKYLRANPPGGPPATTE